MKKKVLIGIVVVLAIVVVVLVAMVFFKPGEEKLAGGEIALTSSQERVEEIREPGESNTSNENTETQGIDASVYVMPKEKEEKGIIEQIKDFITPIILIIYSINTVISVLV